MGCGICLRHCAPRSKTLDAPSRRTIYCVPIRSELAVIEPRQPLGASPVRAWPRNDHSQQTRRLRRHCRNASGRASGASSQCGGYRGRDAAAAGDRGQTIEGAGACRVGDCNARRRGRISPGAPAGYDLGRRGRRRDRRRYRRDAMLGSLHGADCERTTYCPTRPHWGAINRAVGAALSAVSLQDMVTPFAVRARRALPEPANTKPPPLMDAR